MQALRRVPARKTVLLRLDPTVHNALARWAGDELRSNNAQIEFILRNALSDAGRLPGETKRIRQTRSSQTKRRGEHLSNLAG
jgi:hypothetical protein